MKDIYTKYQRFFPAGFFVIGFLVDVFTTDRIDQSFSLIQQLIYLFLIMLMLYLEVIQPKFFKDGPAFIVKIWHYHVVALHFLFGSLLSLYTIFYFKSASLINSFVFVGVMVGLLVANELPRFQNRGLTIRFSMLATCLTSYFIYLVPVITKNIGLGAFSMAVILSMSLFLILVVRLQKQAVDPDIVIFQGLLPGVIVNLIFCALYLLKVLPPVPLSLKYIGVYHDIQKMDGQYNLRFEREGWWRYFENGAQTFLATDGDKVHCFVQIFSPTDFSEKIQLVWMKKTKGDWKKWDSIPMAISGGRTQGYRGSVNKSKFEMGQWQVRVMTSDNRELGRIYFDVKPRESNGPRVLQLHQR